MCDGKSCGRHGGMCAVSWVAKILLIIGGLNWGLIGVSMLLGKMYPWDVVSMLLGSWPMVQAIVYVLVGVAAVVKLLGCHCKKCVDGTCEGAKMSQPTMGGTM